jgi:hypothetical protein
LNDSTLKNVHWALCTGVFGKRDVGRIEREFLDVLDFQLSVSEDDILSHHHNFIAVAHNSNIYRHSAISVHPSTAHPKAVRYSTNVPSLDPSSPESSSSDSSPSTPSTLASSSSPEFALADSSPESALESSNFHHHYSKTRVQAKQQPPSRPKRSSFHLPNSTMDLLRSFPVPLHHYRQNHRSQPRAHAMPTVVV